MSAQEETGPTPPPIVSITVDTQRAANYVINRGPVAVVAALRRAVEKITEHASGFSTFGLPWYPRGDDDYEDEWQVACQPTPAYPGASVFIGGGYIVDELDEKKARWFALFGPQIAGALCALLVDVACAVDNGEITINTDHGTTTDYARHAVELAVEILHEEDPDDDL